jgi:hypothetical protein
MTGSIKNKSLAVAALNSGGLSERSRERILAALKAEPQPITSRNRKHQRRKGTINEMAR